MSSFSLSGTTNIVPVSPQSRCSQEASNDSSVSSSKISRKHGQMSEEFVTSSCQSPSIKRKRLDTEQTNLDLAEELKASTEVKSYSSNIEKSSGIHPIKNSLKSIIPNKEFGSNTMRSQKRTDLPPPTNSDCLKALIRFQYKKLAKILKNGFNVNTIISGEEIKTEIMSLRRWKRKMEFLRPKSCIFNWHPCKYTLLHLAVFFEDIKMVVLFLDHSADVTLQDSLGKTVVHHACKFNLLKILEVLIQSANRNVMRMLDIFGETPFTYACRHGSLDLIQYLVQLGAHFTVTYDKKRNLMFDVLKNKRCTTDMIKLLVDHGADLSSRNENGKVPLQLLIDMFESQPALRDALIHVIERSSFNGKYFHGYMCLGSIARLGDTDLFRKALNADFTQNYKEVALYLIFTDSRERGGDYRKKAIDLIIDSGLESSTCLCFLQTRILTYHNAMKYYKDCFSHLMWRHRQLKSLKFFCRIVIRKSLQGSKEIAINHLLLPVEVKNFLLLQE